MVASLRRALERVLTFVRLSGIAAWRSFVRFYNSNDLTHASSIAYFGLLSFFPLLLLALNLLGQVAGSEADRAAVLNFVFRYFPRQLDFVTNQLDALERWPVTLSVASTLLLVWASLGVFGAITTAVNDAWGVEKHPNYLEHKLVSLLMLVAASALLLLALLVVTVAGVVRASWFAAVVEQRPGLAVLGGVACRWSSTLLLMFVVGLIFYFVPNTKVRLRDVWPGAILTGLLWRGALLGFSWYVRDLGRFSVHGSIATVVVFLLWVYVSAVILLYGVEFTAAFAELLGDRAAARREQQAVTPT